LNLTEQFAADELMFISITHDPEARRRSYELLANEW
jgi:hypothetical protein